MNTENVGRIEPVAHMALRHRVVQRLLAAIVTGKLTTGTRLVAKRLAEQLGVSATPIREALVELEQMGLVEILHNRGAVARPFNRKELREIFHLRRILEREATLCAAARIDAPLVHPLKHELQVMLQQRLDAPVDWLRDSVAHNRRLHGLMVEQCGNGRLANEIRRYHMLFEALIEATGSQTAIHREMLAGHMEVIDALLAGNATGAADAMAQHIDNVGCCLEGALFDHQPVQP
jgi:DNA-binding GntR family transcriptional regulator